MRRPIRSDAARPRHPPRRRRRFGQHFLAPLWARRVLTAIAPVPGDVFLEIGPGTGALTLPLAATGVPILAVEIDRDLSAALAARAPANVTLLTGDFLRLDVVPVLRGLEPSRPPGAPGSPTPPRFRVAGNLPYNLSSPILFRLIELAGTHDVLADATLMLQREVADRLVAAAGTKAYGTLTVLTQVRAQVSKLLDLPPGAFTPAPRVWSSLVRLTFHPPRVRVVDDARFARLVKGLFSQRRKTLTNALKRFDPAGPEVLARSGLDGRRRPETLQLIEIARLAELLESVRRPAVL